MKSNLIVAVYFITFWIVLPVVLITGAGWIDGKYFPDRILPDYFSTIGWLIIIIGLISLVYAVFQFRKISGVYPVSALPPAKLIERGVFAVWRHPIYLFACLIFLGMSFSIRSFGFLFVILPIAIISVGIYIWVEELFLVRRFGEKYVCYKRRVPLVFPKFINVLRVLAAPLFRFWFRMKIYHPENIPDSSPYFVVSAHRNYFDPFFISYALPHMVKHICTYEMFRGQIKSAIFKLMGAIPKKRYKTDLQSNRLLIKALNDGYAIGLFPEGGRSWTGEMRSLKPETLLLLQHFYKIPILPVRLEGNYHSWPRWSNGLLKADLKVTLEEPFHFNLGMTIGEIESILQEKIRARPEIEEPMICRSKNRIGKLSIVIYRCPCCNAIETLKEIPPDTFLCNMCKKQFVLQPNLKLTYSIDSQTRTESIHSIYRKIQIKESDLVELPGKLTPPLNSVILSDSETMIYNSIGQYWDETGSTFQLKMNGEILLTNQRIHITSGENKFTLNLMDIDAVTIESNKKLQIYRKKTDHLIQILFQSSSALLWQDLLVLVLDKSFGKKVITR